MKMKATSLERRIRKLQADLEEANWAYDCEVANNAKLRERVSMVLTWCENKQRMKNDGPTSAAIIHCARIVQSFLSDDSVES